eukprot:2231789-Prymnesium_polylepis.1
MHGLLSRTFLHRSSRPLFFSFAGAPIGIAEARSRVPPEADAAECAAPPALISTSSSSAACHTSTSSPTSRA